MQIERNEIRAFLLIVEEGGFGRAAERLNLSQSAVSQAIANLEHKLNSVLLVRGRTPTLTEAGRRFFKYAQSVTREENEALEDIQRIRTGAMSTLSLAMNSLIQELYGCELITRFCERNPLTRLEVDVAPSREIVYGVDEERWELGFGPFQHEMPGHFDSQPYFQERRLLVVHRNHPRFDALMSDPMQALSSVVLITSYLDDATRRPGLERLRNAFASVWEVSNMDLRRDLASAGFGVLFVSDRLLHRLHDFTAIDKLEFSAIERQVGIYYKKHKALSAAAKRFMAICQARFSE